MDNSPQDDPQRGGDAKTSTQRAGPNIWVLLLFIGVMGVALLTIPWDRKSIVPYSFFLEQIRQDNILYVKLGQSDGTGQFKEPPEKAPEFDREGKRKEVTEKDAKYHKHFRVILPSDSQSRGVLTKLLGEKNVRYENEPPSNALLVFYMLVLLVPLALFAFFWFSYRRTRDQMMGGGFLAGFSKSPAKRYEGIQQPVTFADVLT